jgi:hypothetical protein
VKKTYLLSARFRGMEPGDSVFLTDAGQPFEVEEEYLAEYVGYLRRGEGFLGDLLDVFGGDWHVEQVFAHEIGDGVEQ